MSPRGKRVPDEDVLDDLHRLADELERTPGWTDLLHHGAYAPKTYTKRFGGIDEALKTAGLDPANKRGRQGGIEDRELIEDLERLGDELGRRPTQADIDEYGEFSSMTYYNHFGSLPNALLKAGFSDS